MRNIQKFKEQISNWAQDKYFADPSIQYAAITIRFNPCSDIDASISLRHFLNRLNRKLLGYHYRRDHRRLSVMVTFEGAVDSRHAHLMIENPLGFGIEFGKAVREAWLQTRKSHQSRFRNEVPHVVSVVDPGWLDYMSKLRTKTDYADSFDVENWQ